MARDKVRLRNGQHWSAQDFVDHYKKPTASGTPTPIAGPPQPVDVDMSWYMGEGPGRYYHPGMFPIIHQIIDSRSMAPGVYELEKLASDKNSLKAQMSNYGLDVRSGDYPLRALVFGNESARISGQVIVNKDGSKTFKKIEIKPFDSNFDFDHNTRDPFLESAREAGRLKYDAENHGRSYEIQYRGNGNFDEPYSDRGIGRIYHPFTAPQLTAALRKEFVYPGSSPPGLLPSFTAAPPPAIKAHLQYLDQTIAGQSRANGASAAPPLGHSVNPSPPPNDVAGWIASMAGVDPTNPMQPQQSTVEASSGNLGPPKLLPPWVFLGPQ